MARVHRRHHACRGNERRGGEEWLIDADGRDLLLVRIPGRVHYPADRMKALETPGWQAALDWSPEEAVAMQIAFRVVHPEISRWSLAVGDADDCALPSTASVTV